MKKTKDIISQENKFLRLCGSNYRDKIKKKIPMTVGDFQKFMYLFNAMGLSEYSIYFSMEMFPELLVEYGERSKDNEWDIGYRECDFPIEEMVSICEEWMQEFCDQMPLESQRKKYRKVFEID